MEEVQTLRMNLIFLGKYILLITLYIKNVVCTLYTHCGWDIGVPWLERLAVNTKVATVLGSIPASSKTVESEGLQMKLCWITYMKRKNQKILRFYCICTVFNLVHSQILHCFRWGTENGGGNYERHAGDSNPGRHVPTDPPQLQGSIIIFCIHNFYS